MQPARFRSFAEHHLPMLYWLACVAISTVAVTLILWSAMPGAIFALLAVPLLLLAGLAAALAEMVQALRHQRRDPRTLGFAAIGTIGLGAAGLPLAAGLALATHWMADGVTLMRWFPVYQQIVAEAQRGAIESSGDWQDRGAIQIIVEKRPNARLVFRFADGSMQGGIVYDPGGGVATTDPANPALENLRHHIGHATLHDCRRTWITAYYRCDIREFDED